MVRVTFRPADGGPDFPVYFEEGDEEGPAEAASLLKATEIARQPSNAFILLAEQLDALARAK